MDKQPTHDAEEHELARWLLERLPRPTDGECLDELALASYLDGLADAREVERVDSHLASCPRCRRSLLDARGLRGEPAAPEGLLGARARRLVPAWPRSRWQRGAGWVAAAAAAVVIGLAGLQAGSAFHRARVRTDGVLLTEITFGSGEPTPAADMLEGLVEQAEEARR